MRLNITKSKIFIGKQKEAITEQIKETEVELKIIKSEKDKLIGTVAEGYANKKINEYYMKNMLYNSPECKTKFFKDEEYEELDNSLIEILYENHEKYLKKFSINNIKKIALSPIYMNMFILSNDDAYSFYGKPIIYLTFFQAQTFEYAKTFKNIISNAPNKIPEEYLSDPDKLVEWYESTQEANKILDKNKKRNNGKEKIFEATSLVGASKTDLKNLGLQEESVDIFKLAKQKGGLNMDELMKAQGI